MAKIKYRMTFDEGVEALRREVDSMQNKPQRGIIYGGTPFKALRAPTWEDPGKRAGRRKGPFGALFALLVGAVILTFFILMATSTTSLVIDGKDMRDHKWKVPNENPAGIHKVE